MSTSQNLTVAPTPTIVLSPYSKLFIETEGQDDDSKLISTFKTGSGEGLLYLDSLTDHFVSQSDFSYWRDFVRLYLSLFASIQDLDKRDLVNNPVTIALPSVDLSRLKLTIPPMKGAEYINEDSLTVLWNAIGQALQSEILKSNKNISEFFEQRHSSLSLLGRVCFHLAENKNSIEEPFAFLATFAHQISIEGKTQHLPLNRALEEYAGAKQKINLLRLLSPIQKASKESEFIKNLVDSGDIYHTLAWNAKEAHGFLKAIPIFEKSGIAVRFPNWWKQKNANRPQVSIKLGDKTPSKMGFDALVDFSMSVMLGDKDLSQKEIQYLLDSSENLIFFKGQWVEVDKDKLSDILNKWKSVSQSVGGELSFGEAMRLLSGMESSVVDLLTQDEQSLTRIVSGSWLEKIFEQIRSPEISQKVDGILKNYLLANLRPYQRIGVAWLFQLNQMQLGGVLADDMGLGKTIQIISLILLRLHIHSESSFHCLLVVPASLIGNWKSELGRFAPSLSFWVAHPSGNGYQKPSGVLTPVTITTYGSISKMKWLADFEWSAIIADEAQAIKNPNAKQSKTLKSLKSKHRLALTGTPVENHLSDLWSLFDFVSPGLLGSSKAFDSFVKKSRSENSSPYASVRKLVQPYILRRLKTDKTVIQDLPEKTEMKTYCSLSNGQIALYQKSVASLVKEIQHADGIKRRGIVLSYLMRLKQICNHPSQFVKDGRFLESDSGKFQRLREICEVIAEKQEKLLVFSQFKEMTEPISDFLKSIFRQPGLVLHGEVPIKKRSQLVSEFQRDDGPPYFVLSLKAGGTGLNLTAASHVIHFDRWWNPATENQATDRAFRIGQKRNVLVHKFICKGTLEDKIDEIIESKRSMSNELLEGGDAAILTELGNDELLKIVTLDINSAGSDI